MTPKEKAQELVDRFREFADGTDAETDRYSPNIEKQNAKQCALIAIDEILNNAVKYNAYDGVINNELWADDEYWQEVKKEIEKL
jgi:hypothetical protein